MEWLRGPDSGTLAVKEKSCISSLSSDMRAKENFYCNQYPHHSFGNTAVFQHRKVVFLFTRLPVDDWYLFPRTAKLVIVVKAKIRLRERAVRFFRVKSWKFIFRILHSWLCYIFWHVMHAFVFKLTILLVLFPSNYSLGNKFLVLFFLFLFFGVSWCFLVRWVRKWR